MKIVLALLVLSRLAAADTVKLVRTCVEVAPGAQLDARGQAAALQMLGRALEEQDLFVVDGDCDQTFRVEHLTIAGDRVIRISGPHGSRRWSNPGTDLMGIYRVMVASLLAEPETPDLEPPSTIAPAVESTDTRAAARPATGMRAAAAPAISREAPPAPFPTPIVAEPSTRSRWYVAAGAADLGGGGSGFNLSGGYRRPLDTAMIDFRLHTFSGQGSAMVEAGIDALAVSSEKLYAGGGLSLASAQLADQTLTGGGLALHGVAGLLLSDPGPRSQLFCQVELTLPMFRATSMTSGARSYPAMIGLGLGLAW